MENKEQKTRTILFTILDDLIPLEGPHHKELKYSSVEDLEKQIMNFIIDIQKNIETDPTYYFRTYKWGEINKDLDIKGITKTLIREGYWVRNRVQKYYVIAFALDYTRFEVFSKDCDKQLINWGWGMEGPIKGLIHSEDYNENPIIKMMKSLDIVPG